MTMAYTTVQPLGRHIANHFGDAVPVNLLNIIQGNHRQQTSPQVPHCLQCFDAVGWAAGRASGLEKTEWWAAGMVICLRRGADLYYSPADASV